MLGRRPGFTALAILTLAIGIGVNTVAFSAVNALLFKTSDFPDVDRLGWVMTQTPGNPNGSTALPEVGVRSQESGVERYPFYRADTTAYAEPNASHRPRIPRSRGTHGERTEAVTVQVFLLVTLTASGTTRPLQVAVQAANSRITGMSAPTALTMRPSVRPPCASWLRGMRAAGLS